MPPATPARGADPRVARSRAAVLDATARLLEEGGLAAATIDAIRDRSGVSKTTIYKHWPNRLCVAVDAFAERLAIDAGVRDTGVARTDLREQLRRVSAFYASPLGRVFTALLAAAVQDDAALELLRDRLLASREHATQVLWERAAARHEVRSDLDADLALDLLFAPAMWRLITGRPSLSEAEMEALVGLVLE